MTQPTLTRQQGQAFLANRLNPSHFQESYVYNVYLDELDFGQSTPVNLLIQADSDFEWSDTSIHVVTAADNRDIDYLNCDRYGGLLVQIADGASQVPLSNMPVPTSAIFGTGMQPRRLPQKRIIPRNSVLVFTFSNIYNSVEGNLFNIDVSLIGQKLYTGNV